VNSFGQAVRYLVTVTQQMQNDSVNLSFKIEELLHEPRK
jgi:hypothetical protein